MCAADHYIEWFHLTENMLIRLGGFLCGRTVAVQCEVHGTVYSTHSRKQHKQQSQAVCTVWVLKSSVYQRKRSNIVEL